MMPTRIAAIEYALPEQTRTVRELAAAGLLQSDPAVLESFGFDRIHVAERESPYELALSATRRLLDTNGVPPAAIGALVYGGAQGATSFECSPAASSIGNAQRTTARFQYPASRLQHELELDHAVVLGVDQLACTAMFGAIRVARALCVAEQLDYVLCVCADFYPADAGREAIWNCTSDAAVAVLVARESGSMQVAASAHVTKGYYWHGDVRRDEMIAAYFPTARHVIEQTLVRAAWGASDVSWIVPHNVSRRSWDVLQPLVGLQQARLWDRNIARIGHTLAGDNFINLADAVAGGDIERGQRVILFSYGYGAHWTALALEA